MQPDSVPRCPDSPAPWCLPFMQNKPKSKIGKMQTSSTSCRVSPSVPRCLSAPAPFRKDIEDPSVAETQSLSRPPSRASQQPAKRSDTCVYLRNPNMKNKPNRHPSTWTRVSSRASGTSRGISPSSAQTSKIPQNPLWREARVNIGKIYHTKLLTSNPQCLDASVPFRKNKANPSLCTRPASGFLGRNRGP